ncbi:MAG: DUF2183 domain-containing protein, partial [Deltaproteobacteria bacterium]
MASCGLLPEGKEHQMHRWIHNSFLMGVLWAVLVSFPSPVRAFGKVRVEVQLMPGFCSPQHGCTVRGRLVRYSTTIEKNNRKRTKKWNQLAGSRRFLRRSVKKKWVDVRMGIYQQRVRSGKHGLFFVRFPFPKNIQGNTPRQVANWGGKIVWGGRSGVFRVTATFPKQGRYQRSVASGTVVAPRSSKGLSIISDLDDTLIVSNAYSKRKVIKKIMNTHASQTQLVPGAHTFLREVLASPHGKGGGTLHYLSGSPFAILDRIQWMFAARSFPIGSVTLSPVFRVHHYIRYKSSKYKINAIQAIFRRYPKRRFLLLGDSGEKDSNVYDHIRRLYPKQVAGVLIRHVPNTSAKG